MWQVFFFNLHFGHCCCNKHVLLLQKIRKQTEPHKISPTVPPLEHQLLFQDFPAHLLKEQDLHWSDWFELHQLDSFKLTLPAQINPHSGDLWICSTLMRSSNISISPEFGKLGHGERFFQPREMLWHTERLVEALKRGSTFTRKKNLSVQQVWVVCSTSTV